MHIIIVAVMGMKQFLKPQVVIFHQFSVVLTSPLGFVSIPRPYDPSATDTPRGCKNNLLGELYRDHWRRFLPVNDSDLNIVYNMIQYVL